MISSSKQIELNIKKIEIKEKIDNLYADNFEYLKMYKNKEVIFPLTHDMRFIVFKLLSNDNGNAIINIYNELFHKDEVKVLNINYNDLKITAKDNDYIFAIKLEIPKKDMIDLGDELKYHFKPYDIKYLRAKILTKDNKCIYFYLSYISDDYPYNYGFYNYELAEDKNINEITKGDLSYTDYFPYFDLGLYNINKSIDLFLYVNNTGSDKRDLWIEYISKLKPEKSIYGQTDELKNIYFYKEEERNVFFFIPCSTIGVNYRFTDNIGYKSSSHSFKISSRGDFSDYIRFELYNGGYYLYYQLKEDEKDYSFIEESYSEYNLKILNKTHIRLYYNETFSDAPEINYTLAIYKTRNEYDIYDCNFFNNYYLNKSSDEANNSEIYYFMNFDLKNNSNETEYIYYLDIPFPKKINIHKPNQIIGYKLMGITGPKYKYVKIHEQKTLITCYENCLEFSNTGKKYKQNCISCLKSKFLFNEYSNYYIIDNNCFNRCPKGYYQENEFCEKCYETCERCSGSGTSEDNNCLSCDLTSEYRYLVNTQEKGKNCVSECPKNTILKKMKCIEEEGFSTSKIMITVGVVGGFILLITVIYIFNMLDEILVKANEHTLIKETDTKTPLNIKEKEMETKTPSDFKTKEMDTETSFDYEETPEFY